MKRKILFFLIFSAVLSANAQLKVLSNGNVEVGTTPASTGSSIVPGTGLLVSQNFNPDTIPTLTLLGNNVFASGARLCFGTRGDVFLGETKMQNSLRNGMLSLGGKGGIVYKSGNTTIFQYNPQSTIVSDIDLFKFNIDVKAPQYLTTSDERMKSDIQSLESHGAYLESLTPVSYTLGNLPQDDKDIDSRKSSVSSGANTNRQFGFLAQEVREIYPELVYEDEDGTLSIDYNGFIPLLVDAYRSLTARVAEQDEQIRQLTLLSKSPRSVAGIGDMEHENGISLSQNKPNPFKDTTEISCTLPEGTGYAYLCVYDLSGSQKLRRPIEERGEVVVSISAKTLVPGLYIYSLIVDGAEIDSKRMIITD